jgi:RNA polymerase sigma-54 factor
MATGARLEMKQSHSLVLTLQMQQSLKLLQLSNLELEAYIEGELERNPLLAKDDGESMLEAAPDDRSEREIDSDLDFAFGGAAQDEIDAGYDDVHAGASPGGQATGEAVANDAPDWTMTGGKASTFEGHLDGLENSGPRDCTLTEVLTSQLAISGLTGPDRAIALTLIDEVDESGYLLCDLAGVAEQLGCNIQQVQAVLTRLQGFEPVGVFARSVAECLALQLKDRDRYDPAMQALLDNLDRLARGDLVGLRRICGVDEEDLRDMIREVRSLTPRPGASFQGEPVQPLVPDVFVREDGSGGWRVEMNADTLPRLLVDRRYHAHIAGTARTEEEKAFVSSCLGNATWLMKSLDQRTNTILRVASEIVRQQRAFLTLGIAHLRPMALRNIAEAIGIHESTVSRVTSNKSMATPRGIFEMRFFFTASIHAVGGGETHAAEAVRHKIRTLIEAEGAGGSILSDDRIVQLLKEAGMDIARRTVAKYREAMRIPSSSERRRLLKVAC